MQNIKILLAEDNEVNQRFITLVLNQNGCDVESGKNWKLAVEELKR